MNTLQDQCQHRYTTSTIELGPHCADCKEPLVSMFMAISRNTPAGAMLFGMRKQPVQRENVGDAIECRVQNPQPGVIRMKVEAEK